MGKFATYLKRGTSKQFGSMAPPISTDWSLTSAIAGQYSAARLVPIPPPATVWGVRLRTATGAWGAPNQNSATPITGAATSGQIYFAQIAWFNAALEQLSPWSDTKQVLIV